MTYHRQTDLKTTTMRQRLRREVPGTVGLLADAEDFAAMRRYRTFTFDDHRTYLQQVEGLLKTSAAQGLHTSLALFDPEEYALFCRESGLEPDAAASRTRFTAELATTGATVPYDGRALGSIVPELIDEAVRQATWECATLLLARIGACADCGVDIGRAAFDRATQLLILMLGAVGAGEHHLVHSTSIDGNQLAVALSASCDEEGGIDLDETEAMELVTVLAACLAAREPGAVVLRTEVAGVRGAPGRICGWGLKEGRLRPLTAAEVFNAYCHDLETGDLVGPESGVDYCAGPDLHDGGDLHAGGFPH